VIRAFVLRKAGFSDIVPSLRQSLQDKKGGFDLLSLHRKIPFLTRISKTGSYLTAHTTIQSPQNARFRYEAK